MPQLLAALQDSFWGRTLSTGELETVVTETVRKDFAAGAYVCRKGDPVETWIGVLDGLVKISSLSAEGKPVSFSGVPAGGWFGEGSLLKPTEPRLYDVVALRDSRIAFNRFLLNQINERLGQFIATVENDRLLEPDARVARTLAQLFIPLLFPGTAAQLQLSQEEIGLLSGVSRQRANQALQVLERAGLLKVEYGGVRVLDVMGLKRFG